MLRVRALPPSIGIVIVVVVAALMVSRSSAQQPTTNAPVSGIPEEPPQYWTAEGGTQGQWLAIRENCNSKIAEMTRRGRLSAAQRTALPPLGFSHQDMMFCAHLSVSPRSAVQTSPAAAPSGASPTPISTPLPPPL